MGRVIMKLHVPREEHLESICWKERGRTIIFSLIVREAIAEMQKKQEQERKEFMKPVITPSGEDYLETILVLQKKLGMVRSVDAVSYTHLDVYKRQPLSSLKMYLLNIREPKQKVSIISASI